MTHDEAQRLVSAYADGGLDGVERQAVEAHIASCSGCADEVKAVRALLAEVRRLPVEPLESDKDDAFFRDFGRDVRLACERAESRSIWTWLQKPALIAGFCAAAALILVAVVTRRGTPTDRPHLAAPRALPEVIVDQEDLSPVELERALAALEGELDLSTGLRDEESAMVPTGGAELGVEGLDDAALQRLDREL